VGDSLIGRQLGAAAELGNKAPQDMVSRYVSLLTESRTGAIATIPSASFAPAADPTAQELAKFYAGRRAQYTRPERRVVRYALFDDSVIKQVPAPSEAQIAERYKADAEKYRAVDARKLTQLIVPTEAGARVIMGEISKGTTLDAAARSKGFSTSAIASIENGAYRLQSSSAVTDAVFAAKQGALVGPLKGSLGWYIVRVEGLVGKPGKSLEQARGEIVSALNSDNKRRLLAEFSEKVESGFDDGGSLSDVAKDMGIEIRQTAPLTADGRVYGQQDQTAPKETTRIIQASFLMENENQPQLAEVEPGKSFIIFDVGSIQASAPAPIEEIRAQVIAEYKLQKGSVLAKAAAEKIMAEVRKGKDMQAALNELGRPLPPVDRVAKSRMEVRAMRPSVPPPVGLLFTMAKGSVKLLEGPRGNGWYVVTVATITPGKIDPKGPEVAGASAEFGTLLDNELTQQLVRAARSEVGVTRNTSAIEALKRQLLGSN
jgi:peptidyl-prolyl cis-trans isomerase D